jgi:hypothetical protein
MALTAAAFLIHIFISQEVAFGNWLKALGFVWNSSRILLRGHFGIFCSHDYQRKNR